MKFKSQDKQNQLFEKITYSLKIAEIASLKIAEIASLQRFGLDVFDSLQRTKIPEHNSRILFFFGFLKLNRAPKKQ
ncbi:hypothetical protein SAMN04487897_1613 [Paenibacillus sp. yr247]|uniref:hypothetical protein n=1 Tax=Paenibacillus sp. yr247 TaxID=1761880 RepID=UPI0008874D54|nr:hypothetical protein [Paenibacillus sp. yr247]SDP26993.1 hypothetical protein SAMN04487897_1613 [Paenibacillus sp. yr247]